MPPVKSATYSPLKQSRLDRGLCIQCGAMRVGKGIQARLCARCADLMREAKRRFREKHRTDAAACARDAEVRRTKGEDRRASGCCPRCGVAVTRGILCSPCRALQRTLNTRHRQRSRNTHAGLPPDSPFPCPVGVHPAHLQGGGTRVTASLDRDALDALVALRHYYRRHHADHRPLDAPPQVRDLSQAVREILGRWKDRDCPYRVPGRRYTVHSITINLDAPTLQILESQAHKRFKGNRSAALRALIYFTAHPVAVAAIGSRRAPTYQRPLSRWEAFLADQAAANSV